MIKIDNMLFGDFKNSDKNCSNILSLVLGSIVSDKQFGFLKGRFVSNYLNGT